MTGWAQVRQASARIGRSFVKHWQLAVLLVAFALLPIVPIVNNPIWVTFMISVLTFAFLGVTWNWVGGYAGQLSLAHAAFFGAGAFTAAALYEHYELNPWLGMLAGAGIAACAAIVVSAIAFRFRLKGFYFALLTFAVAQIAPAAVVTSSFLGNTAGIYLPLKDSVVLMQKYDRRFFFWLFYVATLGSLAITAVMERSRIGFWLRAIKSDEDAAESLGVPSFRLKVAVMAVSAAFTAVAGTFVTFQTLLAYTDTSFSLNRLFATIIATLMGGMGTLAGPVFGAFVYEGLQKVISWIPISSEKSAAFALILYGALLIPVALYLPRGIVGLIESCASFVYRSLRPRASRDHEPPAAGAPSHQSLVAVTRGLRASDAARAVLEVQGLTKRYGGLVAVDDVTFEVRAGEILALIGPNGAGKSTIHDLCSGFQSPDNGTVRFQGNLISGAPAHKINKLGVARTFQKTRPFEDMSVRDNVMVGAFGHHRSGRAAHEHAIACLRVVGLHPFPGAETSARNLSTGQRKRLELARALATRPAVILVDEPFGGLDQRSFDPFIDLLRGVREAGVAILLVEHHLRAVQALADRVVALQSGRVISSGAPSEVLRDPLVIESYLGKPTAGAGLDDAAR